MAAEPSQADLDKIVKAAAEEGIHEVRLETATKDAQQKFKTQKGHDYAEKFATSNAGKALVDAMNACNKRGFKPDWRHDIVFVVAANGRIEQVLSQAANQFGGCIATNFKPPKSVPNPPAAAWPVQIHLAAGPRTTADEKQPYITFSLQNNEPVGQPPPDKPVRSTDQKSIDALNRAIKPYVEKGRASYPAAKKRFLAGLPAGEIFFVMKPLSEENGMRVENVFITVDSIKGSVIHGRIASELGVIKSHRQRDRISFPESEIMDWTIQHRDGSEEGNAVGKFLDTYKPK